MSLSAAVLADLKLSNSTENVSSIVLDNIHKYIDNLPEMELDISYSILPIVTGGSLFSLPELQRVFTNNARAMMGTGGRLNNVTGRFLDSARLTSTTTFTYMKYPYEVFDKDPNRSPTKLLQEALLRASASIFKRSGL